MTWDEGVRYAGFWRRAAASLIDNLIFGLALAVLYLIFGLSVPLAPPEIAASAHAPKFLLNSLLPAVITVFLWIKFLGTPGKLLMGCQVVDAGSGGSLRVGQAALRYLGYFVSLLPLGLGFLWVAWDKRKQGFHDKIAKTVVILEDPARMPLPDLGKEFK